MCNSTVTQSLVAIEKINTEVKEIILILIISIFILVAIREYRKVNLFHKNGKQTTGKIIGNKEEEGIDGIYFHPIIEFETTNGEIFQGKAPNGREYKKYKLNDLVELVYEIENPTDFVLSSDIGTKNITWIMPLVISSFLIITLLFVFGK